MSGDDADLCAQAQELLRAVRRGMDFARELRGENERLRRRLAELEAAQRSAAASPEEREKRLLEIERENDDLAALHVASCQLHSTLEIDEVMRSVIEIAINLIGADACAIYLLDEERRELRAVAAAGVEASSLPVCRVGEGRLGQAVADGATRTFEAPAAGAPPGRDAGLPLACIPLRVAGREVGAIAILGLLRQKRGFTARDHQLFEVLAGQGAAAILAARHHAGSERPAELHGSSAELHRSSRPTNHGPDPSSR
jgi:regulator of replication initiation timing